MPIALITQDALVLPDIAFMLDIHNALFVTSVFRVNIYQTLNPTSLNFKMEVTRIIEILSVEREESRPLAL